MTDKEHKRKTQVGKIEKMSSINTIKVRVESKYPHPKYGKIIKKHKGYLVHNNGKIEDLRVGDEVLIRECAPVSRAKRWEIVEIIKKSVQI